MRKSKLIPVLFIITLFTIGLVNAQPDNYMIETFPYEGIAYCGTEIVIGTQTTEMRWNDNKVQIKVHWSLIGQESGSHYEAGFISNDLWNDRGPDKGLSGNYVYNFVGKRDNVPMGHGNMRSHITVNANGVPTADFWSVVFICHK